MDRYDLVILGGGLAGLTLALQIKQRRPQTSVFVAEKREGPAPDAAFKVGESTVETSATYFADVLGLRDHLENEQYPKYGLRFFCPAGDNSDITKRVEYAPTRKPVIDTFQLDRGRFENELAKRNMDIGTDLRGGTRVEEVDLGDPHRVTLSRGDERHTVEGRWVVDATGRAFTLKRKLGLEKESPHKINSSWIRLDGGLDIEDWGRDDAEWMARMPESGLRQFSTNHLLGEGYWIWMIPLVSGAISIGLCADPRYHPFEQINTLDGLLDWLGRHEPQLAASLEPRRDQILDFLKVEDYSFDVERVYHTDRWCLTGEAGAFADPFYSPGSDFIAVGNTFISDLVARDLEGEEITDRLEVWNFIYKTQFEAVLNNYLDQYHTMGNPQAMLAKLVFNAYYFAALLSLVFVNQKFTDLEFVPSMGAMLQRVGPVAGRMEQLFRDWGKLEQRGFQDHVFKLGEWRGHRERAEDEAKNYTDDELKAKLEQNSELVEGLAVLLFHKAAQLLTGTEVPEDVPIKPSAIGLDRARWEEDGLFEPPGVSVAAARRMFPDLEGQLWLDRVAPAI